MKMGQRKPRNQKSGKQPHEGCGMWPTSASRSESLAGFGFNCAQYLTKALLHLSSASRILAIDAKWPVKGKGAALGKHWSCFESQTGKGRSYFQLT